MEENEIWSKINKYKVPNRTFGIFAACFIIAFVSYRGFSYLLSAVVNYGWNLHAVYWFVTHLAGLFCLYGFWKMRKWSVYLYIVVAVQFFIFLNIIKIPYTGVDLFAFKYVYRLFYEFLPSVVVLLGLVSLKRMR